MTARLPSLKARQVMRALERTGFLHVRSKSSHGFSSIATIGLATIVADHGGKDVPRGTLREIIDQAGLTVEELVDLL